MSTTALHQGYLYDLPGLTPYAAALELMTDLAGARSQDAIPDTLLLLEHEPVVTLGTRTDAEAEIAPTRAELEARCIPVIEAARGGRATYHGPGQLVGYPIVDLKLHGRDVRRYVQMVEAALVAALADLGVAAEVRDGQDFVGVWAGERKIASIGVHVASWITTHGFALNVANDLAPFGLFVPCGLPAVEYTTASLEAGREIGRDEAASAVAARLGEELGVVWERLPA